MPTPSSPPAARILALVALCGLAACSSPASDASPTADAAIDAGPTFDTIGGGSDDTTPDTAGPRLDTGDDADSDAADDTAPDAASDAAPDAEPDSTPDATIADIGADAPPVEPPDVQILTFNTARFFDDVCDSDRCGDGDFERAFSSGQLRYKAQLVAGGIAQAEPDVVCLQEVENQRALDVLIGQMADAGMDWPTAVIGETGFDASLDVAVLSRFEVLETYTHRDVPLERPGGGTTSFAREFLELHLDADGQRVVVFCAHFKSQNDDDPGRRLAEARAAHDIVLARASASPDALVVLCGDLNDEPGSDAIDAIEAGGQLVRVAAELGNGDDTHSFSGRQPIDHIFWASTAGGAYRTGTARVFRDGTGGFVESDHAALRAGFDLP